jgi:hypothetical protein
MARVASEDLTTTFHHVFWWDPSTDDDDWLQGHIAIMEQRGFRVAAVTPDAVRGLLFVMVKTKLAS